MAQQERTRLTGSDGEVWEYEEGELPPLVLIFNGSEESIVAREMLDEFGVPYTLDVDMEAPTENAPLLHVDNAALAGEKGKEPEDFQGVTQISFYFLSRFVQVTEVQEAA